MRFLQLSGCRRAVLVVGFLLSVLCHGTPGFSAAPYLPFPQHLSYAAGCLTPDHLSQDQLDDAVRSAYWRWKANYLAAASAHIDGHPRYRIKMSSFASAATVSEGQGYGMVIVALMAGEDPEAKTIFDGLWQFFKDHPSESDRRLMDWHVPADESSEPGEDSSAFDGDCDIAFALLLADVQWGSSGRVEYRQEFSNLTTAIMEATIGPDSYLPMLGDWVEIDGETYHQYTTRSSDFMPGHFRAFASATRDQRWHRVIEETQSVIDSLQTNHSPATGLLPDFIVPVSETDHSPIPAPAGFLEGPNDGRYYYNAGRDPWRIGTDAAISGDPASTDQARTLSRWIRHKTAEQPMAIKGGYHLDGTPIGNYFTTFFAAPFGVAALADPEAQQWLNRVFDAVKRREEDYFEDSVTLLCLLVMTHNYWTPEALPERYRTPTSRRSTD